MSVVDTQNPEDASHCPFCGHHNQCGVNDPAPCWCFSTPVPKELLALIPEQQRRKACVCFSCIQSFNKNPDVFTAKVQAGFNST